MKKQLLFLSLFLLSSATAFSQYLKEYQPETEGMFYVIIPVDEISADESLQQTKKLIEDKGLTSVRASKLRTDDFQLGILYFLTVRRFQDRASAVSFVDLIKNNAATNTLEPLFITQTNYRIFLKNKDLEHYKAFIQE